MSRRRGAAALSLVVALAPVGAPLAHAQATRQAADRDAASLLRPPQLQHPSTLTVTATTTTLKMDPARDYIVRIAEYSVLTRGVTLEGGHNVVVKPGTLRYAPPLSSTPGTLRALYAKGQTGTLYVSGLVVQGPLGEGIDLDERAPGVAVVLKNVDIQAVGGSYQGQHADLLQTWAGPAKLVVEGFTGRSGYQGFFLKPNQAWLSGSRPKMFWLDNIVLDMQFGSYALWTDGGGAFPLFVRNTHVHYNHSHPSRDMWLWPKPSTGDKTWSAVTGS